MVIGMPTTPERAPYEAVIMISVLATGTLAGMVNVKFAVPFKVSF